MDNEQKRPRRLLLTGGVQSDQEVSRYVRNGIVADWWTSPMSDAGIISIGQDPGIRNGGGKEVSGPVDRRVDVVSAPARRRENAESSGFGRGLRGFIDVIPRLCRMASVVSPCTLWIAVEPMGEDDAVGTQLVSSVSKTQHTGGGNIL